MKTKTVGEILSEERKKHHVSLEALSKKTRIRQEYLEALENNQFTALPAAIFVKGYIKAYSLQFGFDYKPVMALLRRDFKESAKGKLVPREFLKPVQGSQQRKFAVTLIVCIVTAGFLGVVGYVASQWYRLQQPPMLTVSQPEEHGFVSANVVVQGETSVEAVLTVNDEPVALQPDGTFQTEIYMQTEGTSVITVTATDRRGKANTIRRTVFVRY